MNWLISFEKLGDKDTGGWATSLTLSTLDG